MKSPSAQGSPDQILILVFNSRGYKMLGAFRLAQVSVCQTNEKYEFNETLLTLLRNKIKYLDANETRL